MGREELSILDVLKLREEADKLMELHSAIVDMVGTMKHAVRELQKSIESLEELGRTVLEKATNLRMKQYKAAEKARFLVVLTDEIIEKLKRCEKVELHYIDGWIVIEFESPECMPRWPTRKRRRAGKRKPDKSGGGDG